jgi:hypothetical protein
LKQEFIGTPELRFPNATCPPEKRRPWDSPSKSEGLSEAHEDSELLLVRVTRLPPKWINPWGEPLASSCFFLST